GPDDPNRPHGLPLRRRVPDGAARGLRAPDPRRDARRRDALHAHRRGRGAVVARRRDHRGVGARPARIPELSVRHLGPAFGGGVAQARRAVMALTLTSIREIERELSSRRVDPGSEQPYQRTSVMTHTAWVPTEWVEAAEDVLSGLAERHPSRTVV